MNRASDVSVSAPRSPFFVALGAGWLALGALAWRFDFLCDDAYISFRYAANLAGGLGLCFNPGEQPPVEGYSNLLWVLALAAGIGLDLPPEAVARALAWLASAGCLALAVALARRHVDARWPCLLLVALACASTPIFAAWSSGGLETAAFSLCLLGLFERLAPRAGAPPSRAGVMQASLWAIGAASLRVDGVLLVLFALLAAWVFAPHAARRRGLLAVLVWTLLTVCAMTLLRRVVHGEWISHTAQLKAPTSLAKLVRGAQYVLTSWAEMAWLPVACLGALSWPRRAPIARACGAFAACVFGYAALVGGDFMALGRFLMPAIPFAALALAALLARERGKAGVPAGRACTALAGVLLLNLLCAFDRAVVPDSLRQTLHFRGNDPRAVSEVEFWRGMRARAKEWAQLGRALKLVASPGDSIVLSNAGAAGYHSGLVVRDPFGLVDREAARAATARPRASPGHDYAVPIEWFLERRPTYMMAWLAPRDAPELAGLRADFARTSLGQRTRIVRYALPPEQGFAKASELRALVVR